MFQGYLFTVPMYLLCGLTNSPHAFWQTVALMSLSQLAGSKVIHVVTIVTPNQDLAFLMGAVIVGMCQQIAGFIVRLDELAGWVRPFSYVDIVRYAYQALLLIHFKDAYIPSSDDPYLPVSGNEFLKELDYDHPSLGYCFLFIVCFCLFLDVIGYLFLRFTLY